MKFSDYMTGLGKVMVDWTPEMLEAVKEMLEKKKDLKIVAHRIGISADELRYVLIKHRINPKDVKNWM